jgi:hypothetical protein
MTKAIGWGAPIQGSNPGCDTLFWIYSRIFRRYVLSGRRCAYGDFVNFKICRLSPSKVLIGLGFAYVCLYGWVYVRVVISKKKRQTGNLVAVSRGSNYSCPFPHNFSYNQNISPWILLYIESPIYRIMKIIVKKNQAKSNLTQVCCTSVLYWNNIKSNTITLEEFPSFETVCHYDFFRYI